MITYVKPPRFERVDNAESGLYMEILCDVGSASRLDALDFVGPDVTAAGYDMFGRGDMGPPCQHGVLSCTHSLWFYTKLTRVPAPPPARWPTITMPAISIHHLTAKTVEWIQGTQGDLDFMCAQHDNGFFMVMPASEILIEALPEDLRNVFKASTHHTTHGWFLLDVDGDVVPGLPVYKG